ncbi:MAG: HIT domain-containing protein [Candidatus Pacebacteria bacterium]|nr:HIT domain-containing protein [Candidatus Paceibacterota bacterium]
MDYKVSQLRQDAVSGDWIVISTERGKRAMEIIKKRGKRKIESKSKCPFEDLTKSGNSEPILIYEKNGQWDIAVIENKFPAFRYKNNCKISFKSNFFPVMDAVGHHDLVITRDHNKNFGQISLEDAVKTFKIFQERYKMFAKEKCISYVSIFHNWGARAGASVYHPHSQIIAVPVIPPDVAHSLRGSHNFWAKNKKCVHCVSVNKELKEKSRVIYRNKSAVVFAPFVSKEPFEARIFPKKHLPYFEDTQEKDLRGVVEALQFILKKITKNLNDSDYNFFIHTAPIKDKKKYRHYHWHIEIVPKTTLDAGFELSTGMEINVVDPDEAAKILRK